MKKEELLDKYFLGTLSAEEQKEIDRLLSQDDTFKEEFAFINDISIVAGVEDRSSLKKSLQEFENKRAVEGTGKVIPLFNHKKWMIAAGFLLIATTSLFLFFNSKAPDSDTLFAENFEPYKNVVVPVVRGEMADTAEMEAFINYEQKSFKLAANQFEKLYEDSEKSYYLLYQGNALLATNDVNAAINVLEKHQKSNDELRDRGKWYLALAYLKNDQKDKSILMLKELVATGQFKKSAAQNLIDQLD